MWRKTVYIQSSTNFSKSLSFFAYWCFNSVTNSHLEKLLYWKKSYPYLLWTKTYAGGTARPWKAINSHASQFPGLFNCEHFLRGYKTSFFLLFQVLLFIVSIYVCVCIYIHMNRYFVALSNNFVIHFSAFHCSCTFKTRVADQGAFSMWIHNWLQITCMTVFTSEGDKIYNFQYFKYRHICGSFFLI